MDFGSGDAEYKRHFSDESRLEEDMAVFAPRPRPVAINLAQTTVRGASRATSAPSLRGAAACVPPGAPGAGGSPATRIGSELVTTVRVARSFEEAEELRPAWERLQNNHVTSDIDFVLTYCRHTQGIIRPHIVLLEENGEPVALAAGRLEDITLPARLGYKVVLDSRSARSRSCTAASSATPSPPRAARRGR